MKFLNDIIQFRLTYYLLFNNNIGGGDKTSRAGN